MKVSELDGPQLDLWVAKAEGKHRPHIYQTQIGLDECVYDAVRDGFVTYSPSTDWADGGPIMEKNNIGVYHHENGDWVATMLGVGMIPCGSGPTILIAAMRAYVWLCCGEEVSPPV